jgi:hypothetical protein
VERVLEEDPSYAGKIILPLSLFDRAQVSFTYVDAGSGNSEPFHSGNSDLFAHRRLDLRRWENTRDFQQLWQMRSW